LIPPVKDNIQKTGDAAKKFPNIPAPTNRRIQSGGVGRVHLSGVGRINVNGVDYDAGIPPWLSVGGDVGDIGLQGIFHVLVGARRSNQPGSK
jgi:hypothetical protein